jgi:protein-arginine kinase activator protein McsA
MSTTSSRDQIASIANMDAEKTTKETVEQFTQLVSNIPNVSDSQKYLWIESYKNAVFDRRNAHALFVALVDIIGDRTTEHAVHGKTLASYIERMNKCNDQIIKLSEMITKAMVEEDFDPASLYKQFEK